MPKSDPPGSNYPPNPITVDPVVIINNATVIATLAYLTTCCNCNGHNLLSTTIAGVMIKMKVKNED